jgi:hypothetical protein
MTSPYNPLALYGGHPLLPTGLNSTGINEDEYDGPGYNFVVSPVVFDSDISLRLIVLQAAFMEAFECPSSIIPFENRTVTVRHEIRTVTMARRCA